MRKYSSAHMREHNNRLLTISLRPCFLSAMEKYSVFCGGQTLGGPSTKSGSLKFCKSCLQQTIRAFHVTSKIFARRMMVRALRMPKLIYQRNITLLGELPRGFTNVSSFQEFTLAEQAYTNGFVSELCSILKQMTLYRLPG